MSAVTTLAGLLAIQISALEPQPKLVLWNDLSEGMTKSEFKTRYPDKRTNLGEGCFADIKPYYDRAGMQGVRLEWSLKDKAYRCGEVVSQALWAKHGQPVQEETDVTSNSCANSGSGKLAAALAAVCSATGGDEPDIDKHYLWVRNGVEIRLKREARSEAYWYLEYRRALQASATVQNKL